MPYGGLLLRKDWLKEEVIDRRRPEPLDVLRSRKGESTFVFMRSGDSVTRGREVVAPGVCGSEGNGSVLSGDDIVAAWVVLSGDGDGERYQWWQSGDPGASVVGCLFRSHSISEGVVQLLFHNKVC
jgi:hypothetical protein